MLGCGSGPGRTHRLPAMSVFAGVIWHYWLAVPLVAVGFVSLIATVVGYLNKVTSTRYPKR